MVYQFTSPRTQDLVDPMRIEHVTAKINTGFKVKLIGPFRGTTLLFLMKLF